MPADGIYYRDLVAHPGNTEHITTVPRTNNAPYYEEERRERASALSDEPTLSHAMANADHDNKGVAQLAHNAEVKDLGWFEDKRDIPQPLVGGIDNEILWMLVRRFNKVSYFMLLRYHVTMLTDTANLSSQRNHPSRTRQP